MIYENLFIKADETEVKRVIMEYAEKNKLIIVEENGGEVLTFKPSGRRLLIFSHPKDLYLFNVIILHPGDGVLHLIFRIRESEHKYGYGLLNEIKRRFINIS